MSRYKFIYIDDEKEADAIRDGLNDTNLVEVLLVEPESFETQAADLINKQLKSFDGLILDLRLDDNPTSKAKYTAPSLAQALRFESNTKGQKEIDCPIILCSTDKKIQESFINESTSHDLFDYVFRKDEAPNYTLIATKINSLAGSYKTIKENFGNFDLLLGRSINSIDPRIFSRFLGEEVNYPIHDLANYFLKEFISQPGPLMHDYLLAARLGIDMHQSADWACLVNEHFAQSKYVGIYSDGWHRWWTDLIINEFKIKSTGKRLSSLRGEERVEEIVKFSGLKNLVSAKPISRSISTNYWTICEYYKNPLDPLEGFKVYTPKEPKPWQDQRYLSPDAVLDRKGFDKGLKIHPSENERRLELQKQISKK